MSYRNGWMDEVDFRQRCYPRLILHWVITELGYLQNKGNFLRNFVPDSEHSCFYLPFRHNLSTDAEWLYWIYMRYTKKLLCMYVCRYVCMLSTKFDRGKFIITLSVYLCLQHNGRDAESVCESRNLFVHVCSGWQDFNWYSASRVPSAIAELLVTNR